MFKRKKGAVSQALGQEPSGLVNSGTFNLLSLNLHVNCNGSFGSRRTAYRFNP